MSNLGEGGGLDEGSKQIIEQHVDRHPFLKTTVARIVEVIPEITKISLVPTPEEHHGNSWGSSFLPMELFNERSEHLLSVCYVGNGTNFVQIPGLVEKILVNNEKGTLIVINETIFLGVGLTSVPLGLVNAISKMNSPQRPIGIYAGNPVAINSFEINIAKKQVDRVQATTDLDKAVKFALGVES